MFYGAVAKINSAVVEAVMVYVVADEMRRGIEDLAVHIDSFGFVAFGYDADSVGGESIYAKMPFEL